MTPEVSSVFSSSTLEQTGSVSPGTLWCGVRLPIMHLCPMGHPRVRVGGLVSVASVSGRASPPPAARCEQGAPQRPLASLPPLLLLLGGERHEYFTRFNSTLNMHSNWA